MPTNVTPEYKKAEEAYRQAREPKDRLDCLKEMALQLASWVDGQLGHDYLTGLEQFEVIFRSPGRPMPMKRL